jgi:symplekin
VSFSFSGFTRHTYIKSEHKPDYAYNSLLMHIINSVVDRSDFREKEVILKRIYLEAPLLSDESMKLLSSMCTMMDLSHCSMTLIQELIVHRPPKQAQLIMILLNFSVHNNVVVRDKAMEIIVNVYATQVGLQARIETFAFKWLGFLAEKSPPDEMFSIQYERIDAVGTWNEDLGKICLGLYLAILPLKEGECQCSLQIATQTHIFILFSQN